MSKMISLTLNRQIPCNYNNNAKIPVGIWLKTKKNHESTIPISTNSPGLFKIKTRDQI